MQMQKLFCVTVLLLNFVSSDEKDVTQLRLGRISFDYELSYINDECQHIYQGENKITKEKFIIKKLPQESNLLSIMPSEIQIMQNLDHKNIIRLFLPIYIYQRDLFIVLEKGEYDLYYYIKEVCRSKVSAAHIRWILKEILLGIRYLHERNIIHNDLKLNNVVMINGVPKIIDFGISCFVSDIVPLDFRDRNGRIRRYEEINKLYPHIAPEVIYKKNYGTKSDMWGFSYIMESIFSLSNLSYGVENKDLFQSQANSLFYECSYFEPEKRITAKDALKHEFFSCYNLEEEGI